MINDKYFSLGEKLVKHLQLVEERLQQHSTRIWDFMRLFYGERAHINEHDWEPICRQQAAISVAITI